MYTAALYDRSEAVAKFCVRCFQMAGQTGVGVGWGWGVGGKMSGIYREEFLGEGQLSPWASNVRGGMLGEPGSQVCFGI